MITTLTTDQQSTPANPAATNGAATTELRLVYCRGPRGLTMRWVIADSYQDATGPELPACPIVLEDMRVDAPAFTGADPAPLAAD